MIDMNSKEALSEIFSIALRKPSNGIRIYECVARKGMDKTKELELLPNREIIKTISPFQAFIKNKNNEKILDKYKDNEKKKLRQAVLSKLSKEKKVVVSKEDFDKLIDNNALIKKLTNIISNKLNKEFEYENQHVLNDVVKINKDSINYDILKDYMTTASFSGGVIHMLAKGIKMVENPNSSVLIPKEVTQYTGMLHIGFALNELSTISRNDNFLTLSNEKKKRIQFSSSTNNKESTFMQKCKKLAKEWSFQNYKLVEKANASIKRREEKRKTLKRKIQ